MREDKEGYSLRIATMGSEISIRWIGLPKESKATRTADQSASMEGIGETLNQVTERWVEVLSDYQQDSEVNQFCAKADDGQWHSPSAELWQVLELCDSWNRWSHGAFDASLGALARIRRSKREASEEAWQKARKASGWDKVQFDLRERRVRFSIPGIRFDFGAIGKGFVVDRLAECLQEFGIERYVVNASGNMRLGIGPYEEKPMGWPVSIGCVESPDRSLAMFELQRCGIATSGDQYQKFRDGPRLNGDAKGEEPKSSHIVDPEKKLGLHQVQMATIITMDATHADAFATALCVHMERGTHRTWLRGLEASDFAAPFIAWMQSRNEGDVSPRILNWSHDGS
ncbi:MAG: Thiamine biosynthesis lipoprotein ApbE precursor [Planctomycetota bacterium]